jgi:hypothetical protein
MNIGREVVGRVFFWATIAGFLLFEIAIENIELQPTKVRMHSRIRLQRDPFVADPGQCGQSPFGERRHLRLCQGAIHESYTESHYAHLYLLATYDR